MSYVFFWKKDYQALVHRKIRNIWVFLFSILLTGGMAQVENVFPFSEAVSGTTYYVDVNGNDASGGSQANPWQTIGHAVNTVVAGDTVLINRERIR